MKNAVVVVASLLALFSAITPEAQSSSAKRVTPGSKARAIVASRVVTRRATTARKAVATARKSTTIRKAVATARKRTAPAAVVATKRSNSKGIWTRRSQASKVAKTVAKVKARGTGQAVVARAVVQPSPYSYTAPWNQVAKMNRKETSTIRQAFTDGHAARYTPQQLAKAGLLTKKSLWGGIFNRSEQVKYIVMHSTETERPASAPQIIQSWNNRGLRHPGTPFMVDRDGKIYVTVDPDYGTVHIEPTRAKWGVTNSNSIGIEMVHSGKQKYTKKQMASVSRLVAYLQKRYSVASDHIYSHGFVQPSDRTDPVGFDWAAFNLAKANLGQPVMVASAGSSSAGNGATDTGTTDTKGSGDAGSSARRNNGVQQLGWLKAAAFVAPSPRPAPAFKPALFALSGHIPLAPNLSRKVAN